MTVLALTCRWQPNYSSLPSKRAGPGRPLQTTHALLPYISGQAAQSLPLVVAIAMKIPGLPDARPGRGGA